jgi:hypothetical protein
VRRYGFSRTTHILTRRGRDAGVSVHPHMLRHTFAHQWKASGGDDTSLMHLAHSEGRAGQADGDAVGAFEAAAPSSPEPGSSDVASAAGISS